jgi:pyridoxine 5-phosphate synthase
MTKLSVNINKIATLRNARGGDVPNVVQAAIDIQNFGADGITVHPRPDERHIRYQDVRDLKTIITTEFNVEGYPNEKFIALVLEVIPDQVTLVPDDPNVLTSNAGWDTKTHFDLLKKVIKQFKDADIRTSLFMETNIDLITLAKDIGTDRIELYTEDFATQFTKDKDKAIAPYIEAAQHAKSIGLGINAGHDLDLENLNFFSANIPFIDEVSIGHALISDALYLGLENTVQMYQRCLDLQR